MKMIFSYLFTVMYSASGSANGCSGCLCLVFPQIYYHTILQQVIFFFFFLSFNLLIGWQLSMWNCCKPFYQLLYNSQLLGFWRLALGVVVKVFPQPFFRILLFQGYLLQTLYAQLYALSMSGLYF